MQKIFTIFITILLFAGSCEKDTPQIPSEEKFPITNLQMPNEAATYSPNQTITIEGNGFKQGCQILFRNNESTQGGENATDLEVFTFGITMKTPKVYDVQKVILVQDGKEWELGKMTFKKAEVAQTEISQYDEIQWDGEKRGNVFYEIFVRSFADSDGDGIGDLNGITNKLDYLNNIGISGIWLTPINTTSSYHGYDVNDYKAINPEYGTIEDFEKLVKEANKRDIKIILDFVINHTGKNHKWFTEATKSVNNQYRDYFLFSTDPQKDIADKKIAMTTNYQQNQWHNVESGTTEFKYMGMFSSWMPEINYGAVDTCQNSKPFKEIVEAGKFWIDKGVAGFRLDAVKHIYQEENSKENPEFLKKFYDELNKYFKEKNGENIYMVGEMLSEADKVAPYYKGLPALFDFSSWYRLSYAIQNSHAKWFPKDMINYQNLYKAQRTDYIDATKLSNHDEERTRTVLGGNAEVSEKRCKMAAAVLLTSGGSPYLYYGEELGMYGSKNNGDEGVREPFLWGDNSTTTWHTAKYSTPAKVTNMAEQEKVFNSIYNTYKFFIKLRNSYPALANGTMALPSDFSDATTADKNFMAFYRQNATQTLFILHNVSNSTATYTLNKAIKKPIADTEVTTLNKISETKYTIEMPAYSSIIIEM
jgi:Glycosidases